ncbi:MAG TPA: NFACT RNA binding domain-containing protein [Sporosarcina sp.]|nr:NFACT RNA binding domain-containing protein [Sporosarcina sp.]
MAFDGLFTTAIVHELQQLQDGRISKIHQPNEHELIFTIRAQGKNARLLMSIHPSYARMHLTNEAISNPQEPPMFCMVLRKHLEGGIITKIAQQQSDRIIVLTIRARNELGDDIERSLYVEIMGRHSNIILVDPARHMMIDSLKHLPPSMNRHRTILPGQPYIAPPAQEKDNPFTMAKAPFYSRLASIETGRDFVQILAGFSPIHGNELWARIQAAPELDPYSIFKTFLTSFTGDRCTPTIATINQRTVFSATHLTHADEVMETFETLGEMLDTFYFERAKRERVRSQAADLERWLTNEIAKLEAKLTKLQKEIHAAEKLDMYQLYGELLTANSYAIEKGATEATVENYYEQGTFVTIPLDPQKSAIDNAQRYFARYSKAKNALIMIAEQIDITKADIDYFEMIKQQVMQASPNDIAEIRDELSELGYMRARGKQKKQKKKQPKPETYYSSTGVQISVGKNNKQNDYLTFKMANRYDIWLHTKDIPGSHVVIHHDHPDEATLQEAALLAAYFSKARESSSVPVDYTAVKQVKKPSGAKPGFVIYFEQKTLFVTPEEPVIRTIMQQKK